MKVSPAGRKAWRNLSMKTGQMLELDEELCSPRRKAMRAKLKVDDRIVMALICGMVLDDLDTYRIYFILFSERRHPNATERQAFQSITAHLKAIKPKLDAALAAASPPL
jgi:hypothetical protein